MVYTVALALHKNRDPNAYPGSMKATVTTVKSNDSGQIERDDHATRTWALEFHQDEDGGYDNKLKVAIYRFLGTVTEVAKLHQESGTDYALPVIVGLEQGELKPQTLREYLAENFEYIFSKLPNQRHPENSVIDFFNEYFKQENLKTNLLLRFYHNEQKLNNATKEDVKLENLLRNNLEIAKQNNPMALMMLIHLVESVGKSYGRSRITKFNSRFVFPGVRNEDGELILNQIFRELNLRKIFTTALKKAAEIKHNICVKLLGDEKRRPFEDVAMTYVQDMLDKISVSDW
jgi:hypothetical protein